MVAAVPEYAGIAQSVEQLICNQQVGGSSPSTSSTSTQAPDRLPSSNRTRFAGLRFEIRGDWLKTVYGGIPEWPKGTDCKSAGNAYGGSNPPAPTKILT